MNPPICRNCLRTVGTAAARRQAPQQQLLTRRQTYFSKSTSPPPPSPPPQSSPSAPQTHHPQSQPQPQIDPTSLLASPTWSIRSLLSPSPSQETDPMTPTQLSHLLRLSALPQPASPHETAKILSTLQSQLLFVREIQQVDTGGVQPLAAIRDESAAGVREATVTLETLRGALEEEEMFGHCRRPRRKRGKDVDDGVAKVEGSRGGEETDWDPLSMAAEKAGRYFVVRSRKVRDD